MKSRVIRPDIVFTKQHLAVFVDGCYWHRCPEHGTQPRSNAVYWQRKLRGNVERDAISDDLLHRSGWNVLRIWEHTPAEEAAAAVSERLANCR